MSLRVKTLLVISLTFVGLMAVLYASSRTILLSGFAELEDQETRESIQRAKDALDDDIAQLNSSAGDWASWNDTYAFIMDANEAYIESNLTDDTFTNLRLNLMMFVDPSGQIVSSKAFDLQNETEVDVPSSWQEYLADTRVKTRLLQHPDRQAGVSGVLVFPGSKALMLVAARPILKSGGGGPPRGTLIMARNLDSAQVAQLAQRAHLPLTLLPFNSAQWSIPEQSPLLVQPLSEQIIAGYAVIKDVYGEPAFVVETDLPRRTYQQGQATLGYLIRALAIAGLVFIAMTMVLWDQLALSRLARLSAGVGNIGASSDLSARVEVAGSDELSRVGNAINKMLEALQRSETALRESEERFRRLAENAPDVITRVEMFPSRHFSYVSPAIAPLSGLTPEDYYADPDLDLKLVHLDDRPLLESLNRGEILAGTPITLRWVRKDGAIVWVEQLNVPIYDKVGNLVAVEGIARDVTERRRAEEALRKSEQEFRRRAVELQALYQTSLRLGAQLETPELLRMVVEQAGELLGADAGGLYLFDPQRNQLVLSLSLGYLQGVVPTTLDPGEGLVGRVFDQRRSIAVDDYDYDCDYDYVYGVELEHPDMAMAERRAALAAPLMGTENVLGVLIIVGEHSFDAHALQLADLFAAQVAVTLEKARLHAEVQSRARELSALNKASQAMSSILDLSAVLDVVISGTRSLLRADGVSVLLLDSETHELVFSAVDSLGDASLAGTRMPSDKGIAGWVIREKRTALVSDAYDDARFYSQVDEETGLTTHSLVAAPLISKGIIIGVIEAINTAGGVFDQHDVELLEAMAGSAAIATENARLYQMEKEQRELAETLREVGAALVSTLDVATVLDRLLEQVSRVVPHDTANIMLIEGDDARIVRLRGYDRFGIDMSDMPASYPAASIPNLQQMIETSEPLVIPDTGADSNWVRRSKVGGWQRSYAGAPIRVRDKVIGFLNVHSAVPGFFDRSDAERLRAFANQAAIALENARLFEEERRTADRLQVISRRLVEAQEAERHRIARELHDETSQSLTSLMVNLRLLEQGEGNHEQVVARVAELKQIANGVLENLHRLAADLRPASLDHLGLIAALRQHIQTFSLQHDLNVQFETVGLGGERLSMETETALYRIVQEALTNVARHARASRVDVILERRGDQVIAIVEDNGVGFDPDAASQSHRLGLTGMRERVEMLGGTLVVESEIGSGSTVLAEVPYVHSHPGG